MLTLEAHLYAYSCITLAFVTLVALCSYLKQVSTVWSYVNRAATPTVLYVGSYAIETEVLILEAR